MDELIRATRAAEFEWVPRNFYGWLYVNGAGKIVGEVIRMVGGEFTAERGDKHLGRYIDLESAKRAVENGNAPHD